MTTQSSLLFKLDPSRTARLRQRLMTAVNVRYTQLRALITQKSIKEQGVLLLLPDSAGQLRQFQERLDQQINQTILAEPMTWALQPISEAYRRGLVRGWQSVKANPFPTQVEFLRWMAKSSNLSIPIFHASSPFRGERGQFVSEKVYLLAERFRSELKGATQAFAQRAARVVAEGIAQDQAPTELVKNLSRELEISKGRARVIARTEIVRAQAEAQLDALEELEVEDVEPIVEWTGSLKACPLCQPLIGMVLKLAEARGMIPRHPSCLCAWLPVVQVSPKMKRTYRQVNRALEQSTDLNDQLDWGPGVPISPNRPV